MLKFLGIGAQKCGTTWLYYQLRQHPMLHLPLKKELHFWDKHYDRGIEWYKSVFAHPSNFEGEITPAYAILPPKKIAEVHGHFPDLRLIYITRDPIERAWSAALMGAKQANMRFDDVPDEWFIRHFHSAGSLARGNYRKCVENWLKFYSPEQLLQLDFKDIIEKPRQLLEHCARHIGITPDGFANDKELQKKIHAGPSYPMQPHLRAALEEIYGKN